MTFLTLAKRAGRAPKIEVRTMTDTGEVTVKSKGVAEDIDSFRPQARPASLFAFLTSADEDSDSEEEEEEEAYDAANESEAKPQQPWRKGEVPLILYTYQV
jgi:hypothetical protein